MRKLNKEVFKDIPWSTHSVLTTTGDIARKAGLNLTSLPVWYDVDTLEELERLKQELGSGKGAAKYTRKFLKELAK